MPQLVFGGILALILLSLYIWAIADAVIATRREVVLYSTNRSYLLNTIGGLISAVVVGALGATRPGEFPAEAAVSRGIT